MVPLGCLVLLLSANMVLVQTFHRDLQDNNFFTGAEDIFSSAGGGVAGPLFYTSQGPGDTDKVRGGVALSYSLQM